MARRAYDTDVSRKQFEQIRPLLETARKSTKPRQIDLYDLFCAVCYVVKTGCQWRSLPHNFPKWQSVYAYWVKWSEEKDGKPSLLEQAFKIWLRSSVKNKGANPLLACA